MGSFSSPSLGKHRPIRKRHPFFSSSKINHRPDTLNRNFLSALRRMALAGQAGTSNPLISFLNLRAPQPLHCAPSLQCIPSIENMLSEQDIQDSRGGASKSSIEHGFASDIISENNWEMRVLYLCLLEKVMRRVPATSASQRRKIVRGSWNILAKYAKDFNYQIFANIGTAIEWGLLELINFDFTPTPHERFQAEQRLYHPDEHKLPHHLDDDTSMQIL